MICQTASESKGRSTAHAPKELLQEISGSKRARGFSVNRWSLIQECIIGITKLTYDPGSRNPTAGNLIEAILDPQAEGLRKKLKAAFAVPIKPGLVPGYPPTEEDLAIGEEVERQDVEELKQCFDQYLLELEKEWKWFKAHPRNLRIFATKGWLASTLPKLARLTN